MIDTACRSDGSLLPAEHGIHLSLFPSLLVWISSHPASPASVKVLVNVAGKMSAAMAKDDESLDEFDALYGDDEFDEESFAQAEKLATQQVQQPTRPNPSLPAKALRVDQSTAHDGSLTSLLSASQKRPMQKPSPRKRQKLKLSQGAESYNQQAAVYDDEWDTPEVIWTENAGYVQVENPQKDASQEIQQPAPGDFHITHNGPGRPPALGAGHGESLHASQWHGTLGWNIAARRTRDPSPTSGPIADQDVVQAFASQTIDDGPQYSATPGTNALGQLIREKDQAERSLYKALADLKDRTNRMYQRDGEIKMVRERNERFERELAEMRLSIQRQQEEFQRRLEDRERAYAAERERIDTNAAFQRLEQETSAKRTVWPASVRRRNRLAENSQASVSASHCFAPSVAPKTPNKRRHVSPHQPRSGASPSSSRHTKQSLHTEVENPIRLHSHDQRKAPNQKRTTATFTKQFAGFDNSFVELSPASESSKKEDGRKDAPSQQYAIGQMDVDAVGETHCQMESVGSLEPIGKEVQDYWAAKLSTSRQERYLWAVSWFSRRRAGLTALLLAHSSPQPLAPLSLPASRYLNDAVVSPTLVPDFPSTFHRLLDTRLPLSTDPEVRSRHRQATGLLMATAMSGAYASDGEKRFSFLINPTSDVRPTDQETLAAIEETDYWDCEDAAAAGMEDLFEYLVVALRTLMGIYLRLCMVDALDDVLQLMKAACVANPSLVNFLIMPKLPFDLDVVCTAAMKNSSQNVPPLPVALVPCLIEIVQKGSRKLPLKLLHRQSVSDPSEIVQGATQATQPGERAIIVAQGRKSKSRREQMKQNISEEPWDMGSEQREALLLSVSEILEILVWELGEDSAQHLREALDAPGFIAAFLDAHRPASIMYRFLQLLTQLVQYPDCWKTVVACRFDSALQVNLPVLITSSRTPLLELLSKHLVDLRSKQKPSDAHRLHCGLIMLLSQLTIKYDDALLMARSSKSILAALVQSIHMDTSYIWNDDGCGQSGRDNRQKDVCSRIVMDVRLLARIYGPPSSVTELAGWSNLSDDAEMREGGRAERHDEDESEQSVLLERLNDHESHMLLNGIRHSFILSFSRLAFAEEPSWLDDSCVKELQAVADVCSDLLEVVLSPEEVEAAWEICAARSAEDAYDADDDVVAEEEFAAGAGA